MAEKGTSENPAHVVGRNETQRQGEATQRRVPPQPRKGGPSTRPQSEDAFRQKDLNKRNRG